MESERDALSFPLEHHGSKTEINTGCPEHVQYPEYQSMVIMEGQTMPPLQITRNPHGRPYDYPSEMIEKEGPQFYLGYRPRPKYEAVAIQVIGELLAAAGDEDKEKTIVNRWARERRDEFGICCLKLTGCSCNTVVKMFAGQIESGLVELFPEYSLKQVENWQNLCKKALKSEWSDEYGLII